MKDAADNANEGRLFLPRAMQRTQVLELARADLSAAVRYVLALQQHHAPAGALAFTGLSLMLATRTLDALERGQQKLSRPEVGAVTVSLSQTLEAGASLEPLLTNRQIEALRT